jgi:hypothetical protein
LQRYIWKAIQYLSRPSASIIAGIPENSWSSDTL